MWRGAAQWLGWMLGHRQRKHQKRVENREVQEASRRRGDPEAPPREGTVGDLRPEVSRSNVAVSSTTQHPGPASGHVRDHTTLGTHGLAPTVGRFPPWMAPRCKTSIYTI
jgi:hypothetical protein